MAFWHRETISCIYFLTFKHPHSSLLTITGVWSGICMLVLDPTWQHPSISISISTHSHSKHIPVYASHTKSPVAICERQSSRWGSIRNYLRTCTLAAWFYMVAFLKTQAVRGICQPNWVTEKLALLNKSHKGLPLETSTGKRLGKMP